MITPRFLQIHSLHSYPAALINRDDAGLAKRLPFGGATRTRISSQCLKRHWRMAEDEWALRSIGVPMGKRSRLIVDRGIMEPLVKAGIDKSLAEAIAEGFLKGLFQENPKRAKAKKDAQEGEDAAAFSAQTKQAVLFGQPEIDYLLSKARAIAAEVNSADEAAKACDAFFKDKDLRANIKAMKHHAGLESALFGRMVTSDLIANTDAAVHVAHAFTVHAEESESDYFTVVDDLRSRADGDDAGSAGIFDMELTSGLYYGYVVIDLPLLVSNLEGAPVDQWHEDGVDRDLAARVAQHLIHLVATVSPGAKLGSTAPYDYASMLMIEAGGRQPRTLANAFRKPVEPHFSSAMEALGRHLRVLDETYGQAEARRYLSLSDATLDGAERLPLDRLAQWAADVVRQGKV
ncbi:type I-E CRISPR-associated protein Cas7/Cse4/CasC [Iodidimonas nitroreducens]|uniref:Type I-E CRISPR-associated protein Cas7/Cse4/CasC n=1 Tax=Iodidimonas nitroreducens TaxID=1236968 RepID=A0A5A7ND98_9PROT|nr:type I-E CRISPR-associated protein Cas7/Cse4/CasC [Iodidimonas nitroreducens]GAK34680.1 CRISPR system Cascade subunit CasC [alpha proteobacterium Q-1]GER05605.1 type I-E CRISPR-associated protein Cas7/Cse4/CasC [Iodidimonas nitroreducens]